MNSVVPQVDCRAKIAVWSKDLATLLLGMLPKFCHLLVQFCNNGPQPIGHRVSAVLSHSAYCIKSFLDAMYFKLLPYNLFIFVNRQLL